MRTRIVVAVVGLIALAGAGTLAARADSNVTVDKQWTITSFADPVQVKGIFVMGAVLIVHDSKKMARGEACTTFYQFKPGVGRQEELVSFHCRPRQGSLVDQTTFTTSPSGLGCKKLLEYQIAGDAEVHEVPLQ